MNLLGDPVGDRQVKTHVPPPHQVLTNELMFPESNKFKPDWRLIRDHLSKEGRIGKTELIKLVRQASKVFKNEGNLLYLQDPLTIVGDVHGQFYDLLKIFDVGGDPETCKYLFLGDYVDRGPFSCEVIILLFSLKINYPKTIFLLRGNHECRQLTAFFNFYEECKYKYDQEVYDIIMDSFDNIPLACIVNGQFIALHGGISPELINIEDINKINRFHEPPKYGIFCDLIWADPVENDDGVCEGPFRTNDVRGCSYFYGQDAVTSFLERNNLISVIRAHEAQLEGYKMHRWNGGQEFPMVITIFSAPNYCDVYNNKGAVIKFDNNALNIQQFNSSEHPYLLPNFMDIFTWSVPFVTEKITELLYHLISAPDDEVISDDEVQEEDIQKFNQLVGVKVENKTDVLRSKIKFISKMMKMNRILRMENESIVQIKGACADRRIPKGLLSGSGQGLKDAVGHFQVAKQADSINEKRPHLLAQEEQFVQE